MSDFTEVNIERVGFMTPELQKSVARELAVFTRVDLSIPAQRLVAAEVVKTARIKKEHDEAWDIHEYSTEQEQANARKTILRRDDFWEPKVVDTVTEMLWDQARLDAAEKTGQLLIAGEEITPRYLAVQTTPDSLSLLPGDSYTGVDGERYLRTMIVEWNERMIEEMLPKKEEIL